MKIVKGSLVQFINLFGEEGVKLVSEYPDLSILFAEPGDYPLCDTASPALVTTHLDENNQITWDSKYPLVLLIYTEGTLAVIERVPELMRKRYKLSLLVHELTHVRQIQEGRLESHSETTNRWHEELIEVTGNNYFHLPWEKEAFYEQYLYLTNGEEDVARYMVEEQCRPEA